MAIYHLTAKTISRGSGVSAKARHEYIEREGRYKSDASEVAYKENGNMPAWAQENPRTYWESADTYERANGRLFRQIEFALPRELTQDEQRQAATSFVLSIVQTNEGNLPYSFAIHKGHNKGNPHCHLIFSERVNDGQERDAATWFSRAGKGKGGAHKTTALRRKDWLFSVRESWEGIANAALERAGIHERINCHTLADQGIERAPSYHLGPCAAAMERKGIQTRRGQEYRNAQTIRQLEKEIAETRKAITLEEKAKIEAWPPSFVQENLSSIDTDIQAGINEAWEQFAAWEQEERKKEQERLRQEALAKEIQQEKERLEEIRRDKERTIQGPHL